MSQVRKDFETRWKSFEEENAYLEKLIQNLSKDNYDETMNNIYKYIKSVSNSHYIKESTTFIMDPTYYLLKETAKNASIKYSFLHLVDEPIPFDAKEKKDDLLEEIIQMTRIHLVAKHNIKDLKYRNLWFINFENQCRMASNYVSYLCKKNGLTNYPIAIYPGFENKVKIFNGNGYHFFNVIYHNNKYYLVDTTYNQFFFSYNNILEKIGMVDTHIGNVGNFMLKTEDGQKIATELLVNGYIELDRKVFKTYLDAFTNSFRNGLYYEKTGDYSYKPEYSFQDYINFINKKDNQLNHEGEEVLGFQKRPLKKEIILK